jgi:inner membrane protein
MDTLTHALSGALLARATHRPTQRIPLGTRTWIGFLACAFPDSDFVLHWVDALFYFNWHRGVTHSLVLLPLWAGAGAWLLHLAARRRWPMMELFWLLTLAIGLHILGDLITAYGTRIWMPLATTRVHWDFSFNIDLILTGILLAGLLLSWRYRPVASARLFTALLLGYVGLQILLQQQALRIANAYADTQLSTPATRLVALSQPLSPLNWKLLVEEDGLYHTAYLRLYGQAWAPPGPAWLAAMMGHYRTPEELEWQRIPQLGAHASPLVQQVWEEPALAEYRRFAQFPRLYRIDRESDRNCVWFTDERFVLPEMTPPFRYGLCQEQGAWVLDALPWRLQP